jgi:hypothetical protein
MWFDLRLQEQYHQKPPVQVAFPSWDS